MKKENDYICDTCNQGIHPANLVRVIFVDTESHYHTICLEQGLKVLAKIEANVDNIIDVQTKMRQLYIKIFGLIILGIVLLTLLFK